MVIWETMVGVCSVTSSLRCHIVECFVHVFLWRLLYWTQGLCRSFRSHQDPADQLQMLLTSSICYWLEDQNSNIKSCSFWHNSSHRTLSRFTKPRTGVPLVVLQKYIQEACLTWPLIGQDKLKLTFSLDWLQTRSSNFVKKYLYGDPEEV